MKLVRPDETLRRLRALVFAADPLLLEAVDDVDRALVAWALALSPRERLRACTNAGRALYGRRRAAPGAS